MPPPPKQHQANSDGSACSAGRPGRQAPDTLSAPSRPNSAPKARGLHKFRSLARPRFRFQSRSTKGSARFHVERFMHRLSTWSVPTTRSNEPNVTYLNGEHNQSRSTLGSRVINKTFHQRIHLKANVSAADNKF